MLAKSDRDLINLDILRREQERAGGVILFGKLYPIGPDLTALLPAEPQATARRQWYAVHTAPRRETDVEDALRAMKLDAYCPREPKMVRVNPQRHRVELKPMIVGYVLAGFDERIDKAWTAIPSIDGVIRLFTCELQTHEVRPLPIADQVVQTLRQIEIDRAGGKTRKLMPADVTVGTLVRIISGPFSEFLGIVTAIEKGRYCVDIDIFGRPTPVWLEPHQVEAV